MKREYRRLLYANKASRSEAWTTTLARRAGLTDKRTYWYTTDPVLKYSCVQTWISRIVRRVARLQRAGVPGGTIVGMASRIASDAAFMSDSKQLKLRAVVGDSSDAASKIIKALLDRK